MNNQGNNKFFIVDGHALVYRSYYGFMNHKLVTSYGLNTSAVYGFVTMLLDIIKREQPSYIAVVFDTKLPTWRHNVFREYKATRPRQPDVITASLPYIKEILGGFSIKCFELAGYEADDIVGTISHSLSSECTVEAYLVTPDKDYAQLVNDTTCIYKPTNNGYEIIRTSDVLRIWGIRNVRNVIDFLAICGDKADNIPGIPGVGPKTTQKLLNQYDSVECILQNIDRLPVKIGAQFQRNTDQLTLSKRLATISTDVPVGFNINDCLIRGYNKTELFKIFTKLEFNMLIKRLKLDDNSIEF